LALQNNVPIVPVVTDGAHASVVVIDDLRWLARGLRLDRVARIKACPLMWAPPLGFSLFVPPPPPLPSKIRMRVLPTIHFGRSGAEAAADDVFVEQCAARVEGLMQETLTQLARGQR
jgi:1-acyl-sn-glycerol-3-phosphate acyltransferase